MASGLDGEYEILEARLKTLLPEEYRDSYEDVQPVSMGSAGLKFGPDGRVLWDEIWGSFCDLAMAGGPPHRGTLLEAATKAEVDAEKGRYLQVVDELARAIEMVSGLAAEGSSVAGWMHVDCPSAAMAGWLARAINMENVSARVEGMVLYLPAGPKFRLEKEMKNVVVAIAKTCHYWLGHTSVAQHRAVGDLFRVMDAESALIQPPSVVDVADVRTGVAEEIHARTGLEATGLAYGGWLGINCGSVRAAVWMMRVMVASNVVCRREGDLVYVPVNPSTDTVGARVTDLFVRAYRVAEGHGVWRAQGDVSQHQDAV